MIRFDVIGLPAPQGSKRGFAIKRGGKYTGKVAMQESSKKVKPWREAVVWAAREARNGAPAIDGPVIVRMVFTMPKPKKPKAAWPDRTPDLSKLARSSEDAITDSGIWVDDARVVEYERLAKVYVGDDDPEALDVPGARIEIRTKR